MMKPTLRWISIAALALASCSSPASIDGMTLSHRELSQLQAQDVSLAQHPPIVVREVTGGSSTNSLGSPRISADDLRQALIRSLEHAGSPAAVTTDEPPIHLDAELLETEHPAGALDMPAYVTVRYRAFASDERLVYDHTIRSGYVVPKEAAFTGVERLRLALEGATRDNIVVLVRGLAAEL